MGGVRRTLAQPRGHDQRCRGCARDCRQQRIEPCHAGIAEPDALLGVAERRTDRVVDVELAERFARGDDRGVPGQTGGAAGGDRVKPTHLPEPERPQERAPRRGRPHPVESRGAAPRRSKSRSAIESAPGGTVRCTPTRPWPAVPAESARQEWFDQIRDESHLPVSVRQHRSIEPAVTRRSDQPNAWCVRGCFPGHIEARTELVGLR